MTSHPGHGGSKPGPSTPPGPPRILAFSRGDRRDSESFVVLRSILAPLTAGIAAADVRRSRAAIVSVTLDVPESLGIEADDDVIRRLFSPLLDRAVAAAAGPSEAAATSREVLVTAVGYPDRIEIEFADSGTGLTPRERNSLPRGASAALARESTDPLLDEVLRLAVSMGGSLSAMECPEGGSAVTLSLPIRQAALRRAA